MLTIAPSKTVFYKNKKYTIIAIKSKSFVLIGNEDEKMLVNVIDLSENEPEKKEDLKSMTDFERFKKQLKSDIEKQVLQEMKR